MQPSKKEPVFIYSEEQVAQKSDIAREFLARRASENAVVDQADHRFIKRFYNLDHNTYLEGALSAKVKELMGLTASATLRCDDCINYHVIQCYRIGASVEEVRESLDVALMVGGSIVVPHARRAYALLAQLY